MRICIDKESIATINLDECLGLSLATINTNFELLKEANCFTYEEILQKQNEINDLTTKVNSLSVDVNKIAKATVVFDGTTNPVNIINSSGIDQINRLSTGEFEIIFDPGFEDINYLILASCVETNISSKYVWAAPTSQTPTTCTIKVRNESGNLVNPSRVFATFYN